jgi:hypothetical protein
MTRVPMGCQMVFRFTMILNCSKKLDSPTLQYRITFEHCCYTTYRSMNRRIN